MWIVYIMITVLLWECIHYWFTSTSERGGSSGLVTSISSYAIHYVPCDQISLLHSLLYGVATSESVLDNMQLKFAYRYEHLIHSFCLCVWRFMVGLRGRPLTVRRYTSRHEFLCEASFLRRKNILSQPVSELKNHFENFLFPPEIINSQSLKTTLAIFCIPGPEHLSLFFK